MKGLYRGVSIYFKGNLKCSRKFPPCISPMDPGGMAVFLAGVYWLLALQEYQVLTCPLSTYSRYLSASGNRVTPSHQTSAKILFIWPYWISIFSWYCFWQSINHPLTNDGSYILSLGSFRKNTLSQDFSWYAIPSWKSFLEKIKLVWLISPVLVLTACFPTCVLPADSF